MRSPRGHNPKRPNAIFVELDDGQHGTVEIASFTKSVPGSESGADRSQVILIPGGAIGLSTDIEGHGDLFSDTADDCDESLSTEVESGECRPKALMQVLHRKCLALRTRAAAVICRVQGRRITLTVAGTPAPVILSGIKVKRARAAGSLLGIPGIPQFSTAHFSIKLDDMLVASSDGVFETEDKSGTPFGPLHFARALEGYAERSMAANILKLWDALRAHGPQLDDLSVLMIRRNRGRLSLARPAHSNPKTQSRPASQATHLDQPLSFVSEFCSAQAQHL